MQKEEEEKEAVYVMHRRASGLESHTILKKFSIRRFFFTFIRGPASSQI